MLKRLLRSSAMKSVIAHLIALYLRFVYATSRAVTQPTDLFKDAEEHWPVIIASWHGQQFLSFFFRPRGKMHILASLHRDGEIIARLMTILGLGVIRGSGSTGTQVASKGGAMALRGMLRTLKGGDGVGLTADVPKIARKAGMGIITLAMMSGRPIYPFAILPSRRHVLEKSWDKAFIPLPFSKIAVVMGAPVHVAKDADAAALEAARALLETKMEKVTSDAYALVEKGARH